MEVQIPKSLSPDVMNKTVEDSIMIDKTVDNEMDNSKGGGDHEPSAETSIDELASSTNNENDLINVDDIEWSDEDSWLYSSPKKLTSEEKEVSPYKWLRKDVEDPENLELQMAKTALVSKLEELDILSFQSLNKTKEEVAELKELIPEADQSFDSSFDTPHFSETQNSSSQKENLLSDGTDISVALNNGIKTGDGANNVTIKEEETSFLCGTRPLNNATDVHEIARLQEESLRRSSPKLSLLPEGRVPRSAYYFSPECERQRLQKPASVEALYKCEDRQSPPVVLSFGTMGTIAKASPHQSPFGSTSSLNYAQDVHRSSLPNLNRGYYSLRPKKSKRPSEPKIQCPLPIYPGHHKGHPNGSMTQALVVPTQHRNSGPLNCDYRETRTLPSSYRVKAQKLPLARKELLVPKLNVRRDSAPSPLCINTPGAEMPQRELAATRCGDAFYPKKPANPCRISSPVSPRKALVPTNSFQRHGSSPALHNAFRASQEALNHVPNSDQRSSQSSHSSSPRQPLSSVHNQPSNNERLLPPSGEGRKLSLPSKIPGPSIRSGIPVPSSPYISRASPTEETWSHGCF